MTIPNRDIQILQKIQGYCDDIMFTHTEYDRNYNTFCSNPTYRNAIALCLLQIGELVKKLSDEFVQSHTTIPWKAIRGMRNVVAHVLIQQPAMVEFRELLCGHVFAHVQLGCDFIRTG